MALIAPGTFSGNQLKWVQTVDLFYTYLGVLPAVCEGKKYMEIEDKLYSSLYLMWSGEKVNAFILFVFHNEIQTV